MSSVYDFYKRKMNIPSSSGHTNLTLGDKLKSDSDKEIFKNGVINIIEEYGFNGITIFKRKDVIFMIIFMMISQRKILE